MERIAFGQVLRSAREARGLSQAALAQAAGMTAPYLSLLESGQRRPPSAERVERLATALGQPAAAWLERAELERAPAPIRKRLEGLDREQRQVRHARDRILTTALFRVSKSPALMRSVEDEPDLFGPFGQLLRRLASRLSGVGSAREAQARSAELLERVSARERDELIEALPAVLEEPPAAGGGPAAVRRTQRLAVRTVLAGPDTAETCEVDARWAAPDAFLWRLPGDEGWPRLAAGDLLLVVPGRAPREGDLVALSHGGRDLVLRVAGLRSDGLTLEALRPELAPLRLASHAFHPVGVVTRLFRELGGA